MVHQHFVLVADFTVLENIVVGTHDTGWKLGLPAARARVEKLCHEYGIELDLDAFRFEEPDRALAREVFAELEFRSILEEFTDSGIQDVTYETLTSAEDLGLAVAEA